jgi:hypothetical protein
LTTGRYLSLILGIAQHWYPLWLFVHSGPRQVPLHPQKVLAEAHKISYQTYLLNLVASIRMDESEWIMNENSLRTNEKKYVNVVITDKEDG